jgi:hypothetical protein
MFIYLSIILYIDYVYIDHVVMGITATLEPFGCADKPAEKHCWLICCERKILFRLKKQAEKDGL